MPSDSIKQLAVLLRDAGATVCFCTLCSHQPDYGYCYACNCKNGCALPPLSEHEAVKMQAAITYWRDLARDWAKENSRRNSESAIGSGTNP